MQSHGVTYVVLQSVKPLLTSQEHTYTASGTLLQQPSSPLSSQASGEGADLGFLLGGGRRLRGGIFSRLRARHYDYRGWLYDVRGRHHDLRGRHHDFRRRQYDFRGRQHDWGARHSDFRGRYDIFMAPLRILWVYYDQGVIIWALK